MAATLPEQPLPKSLEGPPPDSLPADGSDTGDDSEHVTAATSAMLPPGFLANAGAGHGASPSHGKALSPGEDVHARQFQPMQQLEHQEAAAAAAAQKLADEETRLRNELEAVKTAATPSEACAQIKKYLDDHAQRELLGGDSSEPNPWKEAEIGKSKCCCCFPSCMDL
mmetsp:Transcript_78/g.186  ORF Transcript_78/g.186 Transcript_78/m.186 type:complete len:168 (-) Transcript_78:322-825(-)